MDDGRFGRVVVGLRQAAIDDRPRHRGNVNDRPLPAWKHHARLRLARQEYAIHVDVVDLLPLCKRHRFGGFGISDAGIVDANRHGA